jgi:proteasome lid subunit RPN8/RPN11
MVTHCQREYPLEACGILSGKKNKVEKIYRMRNADKSAVSYSMDSKELLQVTKTLRQEGREMIGIFHSHVASPADPSKTDVNLAFYPEATYVIISLKDRKRPVVKGYRIVNGEIAPDELKLE